MQNPIFNIGDIVALRTHPYFEDLSHIIITGDHQTVPPTMVVIEILNSTKNIFDEITGEPLANKHESECRCMWFSTKVNQFEEAWLASKSLKLLEKKPSAEFENFPLNSLVTFKTLNLELSKQKSSLTINGYASLGNNKDTNISSLLSFVSPVMQIISLKKNDEKIQKYDSKTGVQKRFVTDYLAKCKWFNHANDKMSEKFIPLDCLELVPNVSPEMLKSIIIDIGNNNHYTIMIENVLTIFKPLKISYKSGYYNLHGLNYLTNKTDEIKIDNVAFLQNETPVIYDGPKYNLASSTLLDDAKNELVSVINKAEHQNNYIRITYKNRNDKVIVRTIIDITIQPDNNGVPTFLDAFCFFREERRIFRLDRIQRLQVLNLKNK